MSKTIISLNQFVVNIFLLWPVHPCLSLDQIVIAWKGFNSATGNVNVWIYLYRIFFTKNKIAYIYTSAKSIPHTHRCLVDNAFVTRNLEIETCSQYNLPATQHANDLCLNKTQSVVKSLSKHYQHIGFTNPWLHGWIGIESIKTTHMEDVSTRVLEKIEIFKKVKPNNDWCIKTYIIAYVKTHKKN